MLSDPQTLTVNSVAKSLARVETGGTRSVYKTADEVFQLTVSHLESKNRTRRMVRVDQRVVAENPLSSVNEYKSLGVYFVVDEPEYGFSDTEIGYVWAALKALADSTFLGKILGSEH